MVPTMSYKELDIRNGGSASERWNRLNTEALTNQKKEKIISDLKEYCGMDAKAMYTIWKELYLLTKES